MPGLFYLYPFAAGDVVTLKKAHPCGGKTWRIIRAGADVTLSCEKCGHTLILERRALEKSCVQVASSGDKNKMM